MNARRFCLVGVLVSLLALLSGNQVYAQFTKEELAAQGVEVVDPKEAENLTEPLGFMFGVRGGGAFPTRRVLKNVPNDTSAGFLGNVEAYYAVRDWLRLGVMVERHDHSIDLSGPKFGRLRILSVLPTIELRPSRETRKQLGLESFVPYASLGTGINMHFFTNNAETASRGRSFSNSFAFRVATGLDIPITTRWAFNTEIAWKHDSGTYTFNGSEERFNASVLNLLVGVRAQF